MVQNPKGGGLSSSFGGGGQMGGVQNTTDFLTKSTWALATLLAVLIFAANLSIMSNGDSQASKVLNEEIEVSKGAVVPEVTTEPEIKE